MLKSLATTWQNVECACDCFQVLCAYTCCHFYEQIDLEFSYIVLSFDSVFNLFSAVTPIHQHDTIRAINSTTLLSYLATLAVYMYVFMYMYIVNAHIFVHKSTITCTWTYILVQCTNALHKYMNIIHCACKYTCICNFTIIIVFFWKPCIGFCSCIK